MSAVQKYCRQIQNFRKRMRGRFVMKKTAIINGTIYPVEGDKIQGGTILWNEEGIIEYVGEAIELPENIHVIDAREYSLFPGFIDAHTHLGIQESGIGDMGNDLCEKGNGTVTPGMRAIDGISFHDSAFEDALSAGITTVMVAPGSDNVISGTTAVVKTAGSPVKERIVKENAGLKAAMGEMPKQAGAAAGQMPTSRLGIMYLLRKSLMEAQSYLAKKEQKTLTGDGNDEDPDLEVLGKVLRREIPLRIHAMKSEDIYGALRLAEEFHILITLEHGFEADEFIEEILKAQIPVMYGTVFNWKYSYESKNADFHRAAKLIRKGVRVSMITDHGCTPVQYLNLCAAMLLREGISWEKALETITINPAVSLGIDHKVGSLKEGKEADILMFREDPLSILGQPEKVFIKGRLVYKKTSPSDN